MSGVQGLLESAVANGVAPVISCAVGVDGEELFTTVTALALVDAGTLELDVPIGNRLAWYRSAAKSAVTLRHLLAHTSGLPAEWRGWQAELSIGRGFDRGALMADMRATELDAAPGTRFEYSCAGFNKIMALAEHATGTAWAQLVHEHLLDKLPTTSITGTPPHEQCAPTEFQPTRGRGHIPGIVHDEAAWLLGGLNGNAGIISPALAAEMWRSQLPETLNSHFTADYPGFGHGLGVRINQQPWMGAFGAHARGHGGLTGTSLLVDRSLSAVFVLAAAPSRTAHKQQWKVL